MSFFIEILFELAKLLNKIYDNKYTYIGYNSINSVLIVPAYKYLIEKCFGPLIRIPHGCNS